jgi:3-oxoacyl-[acyl-carrier-protein] synthase-1
LFALAEACAYIISGAAPWAIAGGVDSYIDSQSLEWLDDRKQLMSSLNRSGFPPGEAAGFCLLASAEAARSTNLEILGRVRSVGDAIESSPMKTESICVGAGLTAAIRKALMPIETDGELVNRTYCDLNGERYRSEEYVYALLRTQSAFVDAHDYVTPADCWGDIGAASGPLLTALAIEWGRRGWTDGPLSLVWASSESGERAAATLWTGAVS